MNSSALEITTPPRHPSHFVEGRDLTDPSAGPHAIQLVLDSAVDALARAWSCAIIVHRSKRGGPPTDASMLKSACDVTSSDVLLVAPGAVRAGASRAGSGACRSGPRHEVRMWRIRRGTRLGLRDLAEMIGPVAVAVVPDFTISAISAPLPGTSEARRIDVRLQGTWVEIGRCGLVAPEALQEAGLPADASALTMTLDLDRLVMLAKGMDDAALLRSRQPEVAEQMLDLEPYIPIEHRRHIATAKTSTLADVRAAIDDVDSRIVSLLAERRSYVIEAAKFKKSVTDIRVPAREEQVIANVRAAASKAGIEPEIVEHLYRQVIDSLVRVEIAAHPGRRA